MEKSIFYVSLLLPFLAVLNTLDQRERKSSADHSLVLPASGRIAASASSADAHFSQPGKVLVVLPASDRTPPSVSMDIHFSQQGRAFMSATEKSPTQKASMAKGELLTIVANGTDEDGGCSSVAIRVEQTTWWKQANGNVTQSGPGLSGGPSAQNTDNVAQTQGKTVRKTRLVSHTRNVAQLKGRASKIRLRIRAEAKNYYGGVVSSGTIELEQ